MEVSAPSRIYSHAYSLTNELEKYGLNVSAKSPRTTSNTGSGYIAIGHLLHRAAVASLAEILDVPVERADEKAESSVTIVLDSRYRFVPFQVALQNSVLKMLSYLQKEACSFLFYDLPVPARSRLRLLLCFGSY